MNTDDKTIPDFIDLIIDFPDTNRTFELQSPLTNFRSCHDGTPPESRIVFLARQSTPPSTDEFVIKIKVQRPSESHPPSPGPSDTTSHELKALTTFNDLNFSYAPHLISFKCAVQDSRGPLPGGYITYTVMTKMPGSSLFGKFWNMPTVEREEIVSKSLTALRSIHELGIEPVDRGLRNVIWDGKTKHVSIIDFELWNEVGEVFADQLRELQRWGLARRPPPKDWWDEWKMQGR